MLLYVPKKLLRRLQTLDAIDGKQARRTGSSNALGELFDHGCDSMSTGQSRIA
jgi:phosphatidylglycerophosphate synthase